MSDGTKNDLKIAGDGSVGGGEYGDVVITGAGRVTGDVVCTDFKINGVGTADGAIKAASLVVNGTGTFSAQVETREMDINGDATVRQGLGVASLKVKGRLTVGGIAANQIDLHGEIRSGTDISADSLTGEGAFRVEGVVDVKTVDMSLQGKASAREVRGERVNIALGRTIVGASLLGLFGEKRLTVDTVDAQDVTLENTTARVVRGRDVSIGVGCEIGVVEHSGTLNRMPDARIGEVRQVAG